MRLIIVRHGETVENATDIVQGQTQGTLSEKGRRQTELLARRLKGEKIDMIFSSDLERTRDTTTEILKFHHDVPVEYTPLIRERNLGIFEGKTMEEYHRVRDGSGSPKHEYRPPKGENYADLAERVRKFLEQIRGKYTDKTVLIVTHGGVIRTILSIALDKPDLEMTTRDIPNTCVNILQIETDHKYEVRLIGSVDHLNGFPGKI